MTHHDNLTEFLTEMELLGINGQCQAIREEVIKTGGTWIVPPKGDNGTSHLIEICLYTVPGRGTTLAEAVSDWTRAARCMARHLKQHGGLIAASYPRAHDHTTRAAHAGGMA